MILTICGAILLGITLLYIRDLQLSFLDKLYLVIWLTMAGAYFGVGLCRSFLGG